MVMSLEPLIIIEGFKSRITRHDIFEECSANFNRNLGLDYKFLDHILTEDDPEIKKGKYLKKLRVVIHDWCF